MGFINSDGGPCEHSIQTRSILLPDVYFKRLWIIFLLLHQFPLLLQYWEIKKRGFVSHNPDNIIVISAFLFVPFMKSCNTNIISVSPCSKSKVSFNRPRVSTPGYCLNPFHEQFKNLAIWGQFPRFSSRPLNNFLHTMESNFPQLSLYLVR